MTNKKKRIYAAGTGIVIVAFMLCAYCFGKGTAQTGQGNTTVSFNGKELTGIYQVGEEGTEEAGTFLVDDENSGIKSITGELSDGQFKGDISVAYEDGSVLEGSTKKGSIHGNTVRTLADGTIEYVYYEKGTPYGKMYTEDPEGKRTQNWYYKGRLLTDWSSDAAVYEYREYYENANAFQEQPVSISGTVKKIFWEKNKWIVKIEDLNGNKYYVTYKSGAYDAENPVIMPHLEINENITVYGFGAGLLTSDYAAEDEEDFGFSFPLIEALYGVAEGEDSIFDVPEEPYEYEEIAENPYRYVRLPIQIEGTVKNVYCADEVYYYKMDADGDIYYFMLELKDGIGKTFPVQGDQVSVSGELFGSYCREVNSDDELTETMTFPLISDISISIQ